MNVTLLPTAIPPVGQFLRVGRQFRELENLSAAGNLPVARAVFDASYAIRQKELIEVFTRSRRDVVLDTNTAELSSIGKFAGAARNAPWAVEGRPLTVADLGNPKFASQIAEFAVEHKFSTVLAPTHLLSSSDDPLFMGDRLLCLDLRKALDRGGGRHVAIDYVVMIPYAHFRDPLQRAKIVNGLKGLPFENLWLRISGFGVDATAMGIRAYVEALSDFQTLAVPIIADGVAGLAALALIAFGGVAAIAHGAGDLERFAAADWDKPPKSAGGGLPSRILVTALDRQLDRDQANTIMAASGGRRLIACSTSCCRQGVNGAFSDRAGHYLRQRHAQLQQIASIPVAMRPYHLVSQIMTASHRNSGDLVNLRVKDERLAKMLHEEHRRQCRLLSTFERLHLEGTVLQGRPLADRTLLLRKSYAVPQSPSIGSPWPLQ